MTSGHFGGACASFAHPWIRACSLSSTEPPEFPLDLYSTYTLDIVNIIKDKPGSDPVLKRSITFQKSLFLKVWAFLSCNGVRKCCFIYLVFSRISFKRPKSTLGQKYTWAQLFKASLA